MYYARLTIDFRGLGLARMFLYQWEFGKYDLNAKYDIVHMIFHLYSDNQTSYYYRSDASDRKHDPLHTTVRLSSHISSSRRSSTALRAGRS